MNMIALKNGYKPIYTTIDERKAFGIKHGFGYKGETIEYDSNGNMFGYYAKKVS